MNYFRNTVSIALLSGLGILIPSFARPDTLPGRHVEFTSLSLNEGLSQSSVYDMAQDRHGFLWLATEDGLNRYDGMGFRIYKHNPKDDSSLSESHILSVYVDHTGTLWVGTFGGGLNRYDAATDSFVRYMHQPNDSHSISGNHVADMMTDKDGDLWIVTLDSGISCWNRESDKFTNFIGDPAEQQDLTLNQTYCVMRDKQDRMWFGTGSGLLVLDAHQLDYAKQGQRLFRVLQSDQIASSALDKSVRCLLSDDQDRLWVGTQSGLYRSIHSIATNEPVSFEEYHADNADQHGLNFNDIRCLFQDSAGTIYAGSDGAGIFLYHQEQNRFYQYDHNVTDPESLSSSRVWSIFEDASGLVWIGTFVGGVNQLNPRRMQFNHLYQDPRHKLPLPDNFIKAIFSDSQRRQWVGTGQGVAQLSPDYPNNPSSGVNGPVISIEQHDPNDPTSISHNYIRAIVEDQEGHLWIATWGGGLCRRDGQSPIYTRYLHDPSNPKSISHNLVRTLVVDSKGQIWAGTSNGLDLYVPDTESFEHFTFEAANSPYQDRNRVSSIREDQHGIFWLGTDGGLLRFDRTTKSVTAYTKDRRDGKGISSNLVRPIYEDIEGILWVGTKGGGLNRFDPSSETFAHYTEADGLPNNVIYAILPDGNEKLWLSTNRGLTQFDPKTGTCRVYTERDGLQSNEFNIGAALRRQDGILMFGGINGINAFHPDRLVHNPHIPNIVLKDFTVGPNDEPLGLPIWTLPSVTLPEFKNAFTAEFVALDFTDPTQNIFRFKLDGLDEDWHDVGSLNRITYTNLAPGTYSLQVLGTNNDGLWNNAGVDLEIVVVPPWWKTQWARALMVASIFLLASLTLFSLIRRRDRRQQKRLEETETQLAQERRVAERLEQLDRLKDEFLTNTSHELRTPLNGIIGLVDASLRGSAGELNAGLRSDLFLVLSSAKRLANLVNDLLDYAQIRQSTIHLNTKPIDLYGLTSLVISLLRPTVGNKSIELVNLIDPDLPAVLADENRVHQILHNLVGNAIKFTDEGSVKISAEQENGHIRVKVKDTGVGIPEQDHQRIFESFEQYDGSMTRHHQGTGLGLAITQQLVKLHGGTMGVDSEPNHGSCFSFSLPISDGPALPSRDMPLTHEDHEHLIPEMVNEGTPHILIVDDEPINLRVLANQLGLAGFRTTKAQSAEEAIQFIDHDQHFDLIILDIMMPGATGLHVCREVRKKFSMDALPIILLTAKTMTEDMAAGFEAGANDYVMKPITADELIPRLKNHLKTAELREDLEEALEVASHFESEREKSIMATSVLHNIGNVLNSLRISSQQIYGVLNKSKAHYLDRAVNMIKQNSHQLAVFLSQDEKGKLLPSFLEQASTMIKEEHDYIERELNDLSKKLELMRNIIETQQRLARAELDNVLEHRVDHLVREAVQIQEQFLARRHVEVETILDPDLTTKVQELHTINVLINLIKNAVESMEANVDRPKHLIIRSGISPKGNPFISVQDNGAGIDEKERVHLFKHGYTTKSHGHGFGLHYGLNAMKSMGGTLEATSAGKGKGANFTMLFAVDGQVVESMSS